MSEHTTVTPASDQPQVEYRDIASIVGCPGYRVGTDGSVWSCLRRVGLGIGRGVKMVPDGPWCRLVLRPAGTGHRQVEIAGRHWLVHRLVLEAFVGPCPSGMECRHFPDRDPANNALANLRWGTRKENQADRITHGTNICSERVAQAKLTVEEVRQIRAEYAAGVGCAALARKYQITCTNAMYIVQRKTWRHV